MSRTHWLVVLSSLPLAAAQAAPGPLTVILDLRGAHYEIRSIREMEFEAQRILAPAGLRLDWLLKENVPAFAQFDSLVIFKVTGNCVIEPEPALFDERGPLAFTSSSDDVVLPFGELRCDRLRASLQRVFTGSDYERGDLLMGRALGRVMAHEVYHMITRDPSHSAEGIAKKALSANQLLRGDIGLDKVALARIRERIERPESARSSPAATAGTVEGAR